MGAPPTAPPGPAGAGLTGFVPLTGRPEVTFGVKGIPPPSPLYIQRDDRIRVRTFNSLAGVTLALAYRLLLANESIVQGRLELVLNSTRLAQDFFFDLAEGFLLSVTIDIPTGQSLRGQTFVFVELLRGTTAVLASGEVLFADYITRGLSLGWPGARQLEAVEGPGVLRSITGTTPAAGAEVNESVPTGARWRLRLVRMILTTSAALGTRIMQLVIDDGVNALQLVGVSATQGASTTLNYSAAHYGAGAPAQAGDLLLNLPVEVMMLAGYRFRTSTQNLAAGDTYVAPQYEVEEWLET